MPISAFADLSFSTVNQVASRLILLALSRFPTAYSRTASRSYLDNIVFVSAQLETENPSQISF